MSTRLLRYEAILDPFHRIYFALRKYTLSANIWISKRTDAVVVDYLLRIYFILSRIRIFAIQIKLNIE